MRCKHAENRIYLRDHNHKLLDCMPLLLFSCILCIYNPLSRPFHSFPSDEYMAQCVISQRFPWSLYGGCTSLATTVCKTARTQICITRFPRRCRPPVAKSNVVTRTIFPCSSRRRPDLSNKMRRRPDFWTLSWWVLCPIDIVCNLFSTNHSSESFSFNVLIHYINNLINL